MLLAFGGERVSPQNVCTDRSQDFIFGLDFLRHDQLRPLHRQPKARTAKMRYAVSVGTFDNCLTELQNRDVLLLLAAVLPVQGHYLRAQRCQAFPLLPFKMPQERECSVIDVLTAHGCILRVRTVQDEAQSAQARVDEVLPACPWQGDDCRQHFTIRTASEHTRPL